MIRLLVLGRRHVPDRLEQPTVVEPVNPFQRRVLHRSKGSPRATRVDYLGLEEPDDGLGQGVVVRVADAADRGLGAGLGQPPGMANGQVLPGFKGRITKRQIRGDREPALTGTLDR